MTEKPAHSPLGASSAERWMNCPGSTSLLAELKLPETDEPDYRKEGTAAHEAAAHCLATNADAWEMIGHVFNEVEFSAEMATAVQVYLDEVRPLALARGAHAFYEYAISSSTRPLFYGTVDCGIISDTTLHIRDYKHGEGIVVEVEDNPQIMYYAYGFLQDQPNIEKVTLGIVQPRAFHPDGPVRIWETDAEYIRDWAESTLFPAMDRAQVDHAFDAGKWCRFCPAKLVCPLMHGVFGAAMKVDVKSLPTWDDASLDRTYGYLPALKSFIKAVEDDAFRRLQTGAEMASAKLVQKKANRVWKPEARGILEARFAEKAFTEPELKSPPEIEKLGPEAKDLTKTWAYTPNTGLTVAPADDKRGAVKITSTSEIFGGALKELST